ncbi:phospholipase D-like domain-containing protein [Halobaculum sp. D14]|uniref:phospholipase D-like domain-containing protein n=1 Tax=Halobaculum sp. D14 TaxID=3421642 RepID=UPI003EBBA453
MSSASVSAAESVVAVAVLLVAVCGPGAVAASGPPATAGTAATQPSTDASAAAVRPRIIELYPNPVADGDAGEYVLVRLPPGNWSVTDGETTATVTTETAEAVVLTANRSSLLGAPDGRVVDGGLDLSNSGERITVRRQTNRSRDSGPSGAKSAAVDAVRYRDAPEGERWLRSGKRHWRPVGLDHRAPAVVGRADATAFVLPDAPSAAVDSLRGADDRLLLAAYTFESERTAAVLADAAERGATVRVLVEGAPVGGVTKTQARLLDDLVAAGVDVRAVSGPYARVRFHHAKYAVADDTAVVLTENWKPAGVGGRSSRGWGVRLDSAAAADELAAVFAADAEWRDAVPWRQYRRGRTFSDADAATGRFPARFEPSRVGRPNATVLTAPGNAEAAVVNVVDDADSRVDVIQPTVEPGPLLAACRRAAGRGVRVRLLLSSAWYVQETNAALVDQLNRWADRAGVPFEARLASPAGRYQKVHAKGVVADDVAVVGSLNWNPTSARENREVLVSLRGEAAAAYYRQVFTADWTASADGGVGGWTAGRPVPPLLVVVAVAAVAGAVLYARRRIELGGRDRRSGVESELAADDPGWTGGRSGTSQPGTGQSDTGRSGFGVDADGAVGTNSAGDADGGRAGPNRERSGGETD